MSAVRIALYQAQSGIDPAANAERLVSAVREAAAGGAAMLFTPEMSGMLDRDRERAWGKARREADDPVLAAIREAAAEAGVQRIVHTSTELVLVTKPTNGHAVARDEPVSRTVDDMLGPYCRSKYLAEQEALAAATRGLPVVVVNP